jgi:hypothetical protein
MKVYLAYVESGIEGHDEKVVSAVFDTKRKALDYIIKEYYSEPFYKGMNPDWLDNNASRYVVEMEVK